MKGQSLDNDALINQARELYATLLIRRNAHPIASDRIDSLILSAHRRYVRRLNRCAVCYRHRLYDCNREPGKDHTPCERHRSSDH